MYYPGVSYFNESVDNLIYNLDGTVFISSEGNLTVYNPNSVDHLYNVGVEFTDQNMTVQNASGTSFPSPFFIGHVNPASTTMKNYRVQTTGFTHTGIQLPLDVVQHFYWLDTGEKLSMNSQETLNHTFYPGQSILISVNITNKIGSTINISLYRNILSFIYIDEVNYSGCNGEALNYTPGAQYIKLEHCSIDSDATLSFNITGTMRNVTTAIPPPYYLEKNNDFIIIVNNESLAKNYSFFQQLMTGATGGGSASIELEKLYIAKAERDQCYPLDNMSYEIRANFSTDAAFNFSIKKITVLRSNYTSIGLSADINYAHIINNTIADTTINSSRYYLSPPMYDSFCADSRYVIPTYWLRSDYAVTFNESPASSGIIFRSIEAEGGRINIQGIYIIDSPGGGGGSPSSPLEAPIDLTQEEARKYLLITKEVSKQRVNYGEVITVTIKVQNTAGFNIREVSLVDLLPIGFSVVDKGGASVSDEEPYLLQWNFDIIKKAEVFTFVYKARSIDAEPGYYPMDDIFASSKLTGIVGAYSTQPIVQEPSIGIPREYTILLVKKLEWLGGDLYKVTITISNIGDTNSPRFVIRDTVIEKQVKPSDSPLFGQEEVSYTFTKKTWETPPIDPGKDYSFTYFEEGPAPKTGLPDIYGGDPSKIYKTMIIVPVIEEGHIFSGSVRIEQFSFGLLIILGVVILIKRRRKKKEWYEEKMFAAKIGKLRQIERYLNPLRKV